MVAGTAVTVFPPTCGPKASQDQERGRQILDTHLIRTAPSLPLPAHPRFSSVPKNPGMLEHT